MPRALGVQYADPWAGYPKLIRFVRFSPDAPSGTAQFDEVSAVATVCAPDKVWDGSVSDAWHTDSNWIPAGVPSSSDNVYITKGNVQLDASAAVQCVYVASGAALDLGTNNLAVEDTITNYGTLTQTLDVPVNTPTEFFHIKNNAGTATKYRGVDITSDPGVDLGIVTATIRAVDTNAGEFCTTSGAGSPAYTERCFTITPETDGAAAVRLWALDSEQNSVHSSVLTPYRFTAGGWFALSNISRNAVDSYNYVSAEGDTGGFSNFLLGSGGTPTVIHLARFQAASTTEGPQSTTLLLLILVGLAVGSTVIWRKRRILRQ